MKEIKTKEELITEIAVLEKDNQDWQKANMRRLKELAKAFGWMKPQNAYTYGTRDNEPILPSWEQIFVEVGKLIAKQKQLTYISDCERHNLEIQELKNSVEDLRQKIKKEIHPNL